MSKTGVPAPPSRVGRVLAANRLGVLAVAAIAGGAVAPATVLMGGATLAWAVAAILVIPLAYLVIMVLLMVFSGGYTAMSGRFVTAGPMYTYTAQGLGRPVGVGTGVLAALVYFPMVPGLLAGFGTSFASLMKDVAGLSWPWWVWSLAASLVSAVLGVWRVGLVGKVVGVLLFAEVVLIAAFAVILFVHPAGGQVSLSAIDPTQIFTGGFGVALVITATGFVGFETSNNLAGESKDPYRTVLAATFITLGVPGLVYFGGSLSMVVAAGPANIIALAGQHGTETMFVLVGPYVPHAAITLGELLLSTSMFAGALAFHLVMPRYLSTMSREGVLFKFLSRKSYRTDAPAAASITVSVLVLALGVLYAVNGWDPLVQGFFWLTVASGFGVLVLMVLVSAAAFSYFLRSRNRDGVGIVRGLIAPAVSVLALGWVVIATLQRFHTLLGVAATSPWRWVFPIVFAAAFVLGTVYGAVLCRVRPDVRRAIGTGQPPGLEPVPPRATTTTTAAGQRR